MLRIRGRIAVIDGGREVKEQWLGPNERIAYRGTSVFLTAWGVDRFQNPWLGVQVTRDPGAPLFWMGAVLFALAAPCHLALKHARTAALCLGLLLVAGTAPAQQTPPGSGAQSPTTDEARSGIHGRVLPDGVVQRGRQNISRAGTARRVPIAGARSVTPRRSREFR